jgi:uncharacterized protein YbjT (DUF2867 family)
VEKLQLSKGNKTATVVGATGLIGSYLLRHLETDKAYTAIFALSRSRPELPSGSRIKWIPLPEVQATKENEEQSQVELLAEVLPKGEDFFCALGTTRAKAGSAEAFKAIDFGLNLLLAKAALRQNYSQYFLVSSVGADPQSVFLYSRTKGALELSVKSLPFWSIHIFQPSLLLGTRNENRWGERVAEKVMKGATGLFGKTIRNYRPIEAEQVALCMLSAARQTSGGIHVHDNAAMGNWSFNKDLQSS